MLDSRAYQEQAFEYEQLQAKQAELAARIEQLITFDGRVEPFTGLSLHRSSLVSERLHSVAQPAFCVIAQGSKEVFLGEERYQYDPAHYLLTTVELPTVSQIIEASKERPYLSMRLQLDPILVGSVLVEANIPETASQANLKAIGVSALDSQLLDAVIRLIRLSDAPHSIPFLAPMIMREIIYYLLLGEQGSRLRRIAVLGGDIQRIAQAINLLRTNLHEPLRVDQVAQELGMSVSSLHHQFKAITAMSPLQFQKRLRLQEARRLMLGERLDAASAGVRVGYNDAAHFNREYKSLFGLPPIRDVERLRETSGPSSLQEAAH
jgi:AraC-like DNA-binding protein